MQGPGGRGGMPPRGPMPPRGGGPGPGPGRGFHNGPVPGRGGGPNPLQRSATADPFAGMYTYSISRFEVS